MKAAVVILNWNGLKFLKLYLRPILSTLPADCSLVVADNGSTDGSVEYLKSEFAQECTLLEFDRNYGFTGGYNRALKLVEADYYVIMNSDIRVPMADSQSAVADSQGAVADSQGAVADSQGAVADSQRPEKGWLHTLLHFMDTHPQAGICMPKILSEPEFQSSGKDIFEYAGACGGFLDRFGFPFCRGRILSSVEEDCGQYDTPIEVFWASGACMVIRASLYHKLGGLDESFFAHMEEIDLCWRARLMGWQLWVIPQSRVYHIGGGTLPNNSPHKLYLNYRNNLLMLRKNLPLKEEQKGPFRMGRRLYITIRMCIDGLSALAYLLQGKFSYVGAVWRAHRDYKKMRGKVNTSPRLPDAYSGNLPGVYPGSIIKAFFTDCRKFSSLRF